MNIHTCHKSVASSLISRAWHALCCGCRVLCAAISAAARLQHGWHFPGASRLQPGGWTPVNSLHIPLEKGMAAGWTLHLVLETLPPPYYLVVTWEESYCKVWERWWMQQTTWYLTGPPELQTGHSCFKSLCDSVEEYIYVNQLCIKMEPAVLDLTRVVV